MVSKTATPKKKVISQVSLHDLEIKRTKIISCSSTAKVHMQFTLKITYTICYERQAHESPILFITTSRLTNHFTQEIYYSETKE
jgi:hypothetical protein